ncbi:cyclase family protein [Kineosporia succinea]|uniref:Kynurenine formamidase n=1 Tax=Kineosporia succinea TaxID=84632 RepID=A0ABT9P734_9ACTN|nr:cyclase family protein [Kineosporia succinea]MDP9828520.1 kynurenine formamidase [Kineosporia succinea]
MIPRRLRRASTIPPGYRRVDPRTATRVPLWRDLSPETEVFEGDPPFEHRVWTTVERSGYLVEQITSLGTHLGTHVDAPGHFVTGGAVVTQLGEGWTLMPLVVLAVRGLSVMMDDVRTYERRFGRVPPGACVVLRDGAPGLEPEVVSWLFTARRIRAIGSDAAGPDVPGDGEFASTRAALGAGGVVLAGLGPGLARMRPHGDWISANAPRGAFSGFPVGVTGFTVARGSSAT